MKFTELIRLLEANGFTLVRQKGVVRYYGKAGWPRLIRVDYHGAQGSTDWHLSCYPESSGRSQARYPTT